MVEFCRVQSKSGFAGNRALKMSTTTRLSTPSAFTPTATLHLRGPEPSMSATPELDDAAAASKTPLDTLDCKACGRTMAIISPEGDREPQGTLDQGCGLCKHFVFYFQEYEKAKDLFQEFASRRDNYQPRVDRLAWMHQMQMLLGNYIQTVTEWDNPDEQDGMQVDFGDEIEKLRLQREAFPESEEESGGELDDLSVGSPREESALFEGQKDALAESSGAGAATEASPRSRKRSLSLQSSPGPRVFVKRPRLSHDRDRRISFDSSVVFRDSESKERRVDAEFSRSSSEYSPGRWAAPEGSEWLDTSGHGTTIAKFTGVNRRGQKWVPNKEGVQKDEEWDAVQADGGATGHEKGDGGGGGGGSSEVRVEGGSRLGESENEGNEENDMSVGEAGLPDDSGLPEPDASI